MEASGRQPIFGLMESVDINRLRAALQGHQTPFPEEQAYIDRFLDLLLQSNCFQRHHLPGHITGSAWILDETHTHVILVHHRKLGRWLQPGGHADGETDVARVALREALEETGIQPVLIQDRPWDIDIHQIPARADFPQHDHYDLRYLMRASRSASLQVSDESTDLRWFSLDELHGITDSDSILRMADKSRQIPNIKWQ